jgi:hypothetical protein
VIQAKSRVKLRTHVDIAPIEKQQRRKRDLLRQCPEEFDGAQVKIVVPIKIEVRLSHSDEAGFGRYRNGKRILSPDNRVLPESRLAGQSPFNAWHPEQP